MMNSHFGVILSDSNTTFIVTRDTKVLLFTFTASMGARTLAERSGILFVRSPNFFFRFFVPTVCLIVFNALIYKEVKISKALNIYPISTNIFELFHCLQKI